MSSALVRSVECRFCDQVLHPSQPLINLMVCKHCGNYNRIQDDIAYQFTDYDLKNKFRLEEVLKSIQLQVPGTARLQALDGMLEMEYNESSIYFLYSFQQSTQVYIYFEYQWYEAFPCKEAVQVNRPEEIKSGEFQAVFTEASYVVHTEKNFKLSIAGQIFLPVLTQDRTIVEHILDGRLFFSFWSNSVYVGSFELKEINQPVNHTHFVHYPIESICSECNESNIIDGFPYVRSFVCSCGMKYSLSGFGEVNAIKRATQEKNPFIPLHAIGTFDDVPYEVIGHCQKQDRDNFEWDEFTLWNKQAGFLYLSVYNGHWLKLKQVKLKSYVATNRTQIANRVYDKDVSYDVFNDYKASVMRCSGQFAGDIFNDIEYQGVEYIAPPKVWTFEKPQNEGVAAFKGEHIEKATLTQAFDKPLNLPNERGIGMAQPLRWGLPVSRMVANLILGLLLLIATQFFSNFFNSHQIAESFSHPVSSGASKETYTGNTFQLNKAYNNLEVDLYSDVSNSWLEVEMEVTNQSSGKSYTSELGVEYYSGYESGEYWSEGNRKNNFIFSSLPKGTYQINYITSYDSLFPPTTYTIDVKTGVNMYKNFWLILLILGVPTGIFALLNYNQEYYRWSSSNYSPFEN